MVILFSRIPTDRSVVSDAVRTSFDHARVERGKSAFTLKIDLPFLFVDNRFLLSLFLSYFLRAPVVLLDSGLPEFLSKTKIFFIRLYGAEARGTLAEVFIFTACAGPGWAAEKVVTSRLTRAYLVSK